MEILDRGASEMSALTSIEKRVVGRLDSPYSLRQAGTLVDRSVGRSSVGRPVHWLIGDVALTCSISNQKHVHYDHEKHSTGFCVNW